MNITNGDDDIWAYTNVKGDVYTKISKKEDDPLAMRISIGGDDKNKYLVFRGDNQKIIELMEHSLKILKRTIQVHEKIGHQLEDDPDK